MHHDLPSALGGVIAVQCAIMDRPPTYASARRAVSCLESEAGRGMPRRSSSAALARVGWG